MYTNGKQDEPDYEALNNTFYSIVDSWLPKDFGKKGVQQKDADVLVKIRKAKEKERHRYVILLKVGLTLISIRRHSAANVENGDASTSNIPHAALLKRKLQAGSQNKPKDSVTLEAGDSDDDESGDESRTRSIAKKAKTGFDAFSKPSKAKSKGKQKDDGSGLISKTGPVDVAQKTTGSANGTGSVPLPRTYTNPFAMPSINNPSTSLPADTPPTSPPPSTIPLDDSTSDSPDAVKTGVDGLTKSQRKKQRKKEKKAAAREESAKQQQLSLGKLAVAQ